MSKEMREQINKVKNWKQFLNEKIEIDNQFGENELLNKFSEKYIEELINIILNDVDFSKYKTIKYKIKTGGLSIVILFDKYVIKVTGSESEKRKIETLKKYGKEFKNIYNFPHLTKEINFKNTNLFCVVLDKFILIEKEIDNLINKIGYEMISFYEFKFLYNYKHRDGTIGRLKMKLNQNLTDIELQREYEKRLNNIKIELDNKELSFLNDIENMYKEYDTIKKHLTDDDRLDISSTNLALFNNHLIIFDL